MLMIKGQVLSNSANVAAVSNFHASHIPSPLRAFTRKQVTFPGESSENFPRSRDLKSLGYSLSRFYTFWASHTSFL